MTKVSAALFCPRSTCARRVQIAPQGEGALMTSQGECAARFWKLQTHFRIRVPLESGIFLSLVKGQAIWHFSLPNTTSSIQTSIERLPHFIFTYPSFQDMIFRVTLLHNKENTAEIRLFCVRSPRYRVSGYCTKWRIQGSFDSSSWRYCTVLHCAVLYYAVADPVTCSVPQF